MKITNTIGILGFLLALAPVTPLKAEKQPIKNDLSQSNIETRLTRINQIIKEKEAVAETEEIPLTFDIAANFVNLGNGVGFLNRSPSFRNYNTSWRNGGTFLNRAPNFLNNHSGWGNGGGFFNRASNFRNSSNPRWVNGGFFNR